ncbi:MAG: glycosyltransferase [Bacillota bacterium]|nr:glycosyltransferase [Bacillota bacterium]
MNILLIQSTGYLYKWGGAHKANRILMEGLAAKGHNCKVIVPLTDIFDNKEQFYSTLSDFNVEVIENNNFMVHFRSKGVEVYTITEGFNIFPFIKNTIEAFKPDVTVISEDISFVLLETALETKTKTVYISHSQATLPFGPEAFEENMERATLISKVDGIITVSKYLDNYFRKWAGAATRTIYFPSYGQGPYPYLGNYDNKYITAINPSSLKGISIFLKLAKALPEFPFAAVPTWATSKEDLKEMESIPNITILKPSENVNDIYAQTKIFLMPSLWGESFGQVAVEAMLRGIPVIASNVGGIPEAKLGLDYILPVNPIKEYIKFDSEGNSAKKSGIPTPVIPEQDISPWISALKKLYYDKEHYDALSLVSREKSHAFVNSLRIDIFEEYFKEIASINTSSGNNSSNHLSVDDENKKNKLLERIKQLPPEKRNLLLNSLKERS